MDQIKAVLGWFKKQHFWVLALLAAGLAVGVWYQAASALSKEYRASKGQIENEFSTQTSLSNKEFHPNDEINKWQREQFDAQKAQVNQLWEQLYEVQRETVLQWPKVLRPRFERNIEQLEFGDEIPIDLRRIYLDYAKEHFPELPKIVDALVMEGRGARTGMTRGMGSGGFDMARIEQMIAQSRSRRDATGEGGDEEETPEDFLVVWLDQDKVRQQLAFAETPSSLRIWVTQENLWVYTTLLHAIANTNKAAGATRLSNSVIRVIEALDVGQLAAQAGRGKGRILIRQETTRRGSGMGEEMGDGYMMDGMGMEGYGEEDGSMMGGGGGFGYEMGMEMGMGMGMGMEEGFGGRGMYGLEGGEGGETTELLSYRYVDGDGQPIAVSEGWTAASFGVAYKQLPIRMSLQMDQRWLYYLIAQCANAPLQIEVQEVRVNPVDGGMGRSRGSRGMNFGMGNSRMGSGFGDLGSGGGRQQIEVFDQQPNIVPVVIQGNIFIFSKPDPDMLGAEETPV